MSSSRSTADRTPGRAPAGGPAPSGLDRAITGLSRWWWIATPLILFTPGIARAMGFPEVGQEFGDRFARAAAASAVGTPAIGYVLAHIGGRRRARGRFAVMAVVSALPVFFLWLLLGPLSECPAGHHC
ncbi:hypothetical protein ACFV0H_18880 [Streptomyces erythrochromogenes]|uniref:Uncharacterized protein n=1 Tax=Streptomyces erythrochromogenes TaxID=285574 RepID=A0ABZ1Q5X7_9ACTN|nr:hypothetical protein [Streptomyces erythrochromogenes]MCX5583304.1 hypothetical protein [Streptomyces erythrochromogenes]